MKTLIWGVLLMLGTGWFWCYTVGNPLDELALIRRAQIATGSLVENYEYEYDEGACKDVGVYTFRLPDGSEFKTFTRVPTGELKEQIEVEYLPDNPAVNRIKGDGCGSIAEWLWRKVGLGGLLLGMFVPGILLLRDGVRDIRREVKPAAKPVEAPKVEAKPATLTPEETVKMEDAFKRFRQKTGRLGVSIDPTALPDLVEGGYYLAKGKFREFKAWSEEVVKNLGEEVRPYLADAWKQVERRLAEEPVVPVEIPAPTELPGGVTGITNAVTDRERAALGLPPMLTRPELKNDPVWQEAMQKVEAKPATLTPEETARMDELGKLIRQKLGPLMRTRQGPSS